MLGGIGVDPVVAQFGVRRDRGGLAERDRQSGERRELTRVHTFPMASGQVAAKGDRAGLIRQAQYGLRNRHRSAARADAGCGDAAIHVQTARKGGGNESGGKGRNKDEFFHG